MDLILRLRTWALARPRVLVVDAPGTAALRWIVEAELDRRGWSQALSPADADLLLVLGTPGPRLAAAIDVLWTQTPQPRHRTVLLSDDAAEVSRELGSVAQALAVAARDAEPPGDDARVSPPATSMDHSGMAGDENSGHGGMDHSGHGVMDHSGHGVMDHSGHGGMDHSGHEGMDHSGHGVMDHSGHGVMDHSGHEGMDHSGHEGMDHSGMAGGEHSGHEGMDHSGMGGEHGGHHMHHGGEVAGLAMADTAPDRDGLALDVLRVSLGPVLPGWPTGLLLRAELQGDVVTSAELIWLDGGGHGHTGPAADPQRRALDHLATLLLVAGWPTAARDARLARDGLASTNPDVVAEARRRVQRVTRRVGRSRALSWSLRGVGYLPRAHESAQDGDVLDRMRVWCDIAAGRAAVPSHLTPASMEDVSSAIDGTELATARLIVASVELRPAEAHREPEPAHA